MYEQSAGSWGWGDLKAQLDWTFEMAKSPGQHWMLAADDGS